MAKTLDLIKLEDYQPTPYIIPKINLRFDLEPKATRVFSNLEVELRDQDSSGLPLILDGDELKLISIKINGGDLSKDEYKEESNRLTINKPPQSPFNLEIETEISPTTNTKLMGLYYSSNIYSTQCEAEGFRRITYFYDRPDVLSVYTTRIEADKSIAPILLSNGNPIDQGELGADRHFSVWHDPHPKPSYLFALVAADLGCVQDSFLTTSGRKVDLKIYVEHGKESLCSYAMDALKRSMKWDEEVYGCEYDLDLFNIVAVSDFNMGAMENKGLNIFNDKYVLADPETATDQDYAGIETVIAHEYFHNWTGNRITCRDWFQLCLKEGLTVFRDQEFSSDMRSRAVKRIADVRRLRSDQFPEDAGPLAHPVRPRAYQEISNFYTPTVYEKGAEVIRMLKMVLGDAGFQSGMKMYFSRHDGQAATIEQFIKCFSDVTNIDLTQFSLWYEQAGTPIVTVKEQWDSDSNSYRLNLEQSIPDTPGQTNKKPMVIPMQFGLVGPNGQDLDYQAVTGAECNSDVIILNQHKHTLEFTGVSTKPVPSLFRQFSAPVRLDEDMSVDDKIFLLNQDRDPFNKWQIAQNLLQTHLISQTERAKSGQSFSEDTNLIEVFGLLLDDVNLDNEFKSLILRVPSEEAIAQEIKTDVDPEAICSARLFFRKSITSHHWEKLMEYYNNLSNKSEYSPDAISAGRRSLRNVLLSYLSLSDSNNGNEVVFAQYNNANNMTDRFAAFTCAIFENHPEVEEILDAFFKTFESSHLAIDKWFSVQAMAPSIETLNKVEELMNHSEFSWENPNRFRSLIGGFALNNFRNFHRADGAGYQFVAEQLIKLDQTNPQLAARLLTSFRSWQSMEPQRFKLAKLELKKIADLPDLSRDVVDIVTRSLATN